MVASVEEGDFGLDATGSRGRVVGEGEGDEDGAVGMLEVSATEVDGEQRRSRQRCDTSSGRSHAPQLVAFPRRAGWVSFFFHPLLFHFGPWPAFFGSRALGYGRLLPAAAEIVPLRPIPLFLSVPLFSFHFFVFVVAGVAVAVDVDAEVYR
jgi:hypothetical protein